MSFWSIGRVKNVSFSCAGIGSRAMKKSLCFPEAGCVVLGAWSRAFISHVSLCLFVSFCFKRLSVPSFVALPTFNPVGFFFFSFSAHQTYSPNALVESSQVGWQRAAWVIAPRCLWWTHNQATSPCPGRRRLDGQDQAKIVFCCWWESPCWDLLSRDASSTDSTKQWRWGWCLCASGLWEWGEKSLSVWSTWKFLFSNMFPNVITRNWHYSGQLSASCVSRHLVF